MNAVIVPVYKRFEVSIGLFSCLKNLPNVQVIVVDDGAESSYKDYCDKNGFIYIEGTGELYWGGMINKGIEYVLRDKNRNFDKVIFANDDVLIRESDMQKLLDLDLDIVHPVVFNDNDVAVESGSRLRNKNLFFTVHPFRGLPKKALPKEGLEEINIFTGRFLVMKLSVIQELRGIRTDLFAHYGGDSDFGLRSRNNFKAYIYSGASIILNTQTTDNILKKNPNLMSFTRSLFEFKSASNLGVKIRLILHNMPKLSLPLNLALILPYMYAQFFYSIWKR